MRTGEIASIGQQCGNGWRKVFNVYAKLLFALKHPNMPMLVESADWQAYRDGALLSAESNNALIFHSPDNDIIPINNQTSDASSSASNAPAQPAAIHLVMGKGYAKGLRLANCLHWFDDHFAVSSADNLIVCPYFDYRQLSNLKIIQLVEHIQRLPAFVKRPRAHVNL
jgi:hypothetical protein